jgi:hypothetical protein
MQDEPAAAIGSRKNRLFLIPDNVRVAMVPSRLMGICPAIAGAECEDGRESDDSSHQHGCCPFIPSGIFD